MKTLESHQASRVSTRFPDEVLLVSEDPRFIVDMQTVMAERGLNVIGCLGPAHTHCDLIDDHADCPLADNAFMAIVDSPPTGVFNFHWKSEPAGTYAEKLASRHPDCFVVLCGAPVGLSGTSGEVAHVSDRPGAIQLLEWVAMSYGIATPAKPTAKFATKGANGES
jgi:hypothetical protein